MTYEDQRTTKLAIVEGGRSKPRSGKDHKQRLIEGEAILRRRNQGVPVSQIMEEFSLSMATVYRRIDDAIAVRVVPTVDAYREAQNEVLDSIMLRWEEQADAADVIVAEGVRAESMALVERGMARRSEALTGMLRVVERRARLNGLDAPQRVEATITATGATDAAIEELVAQLDGPA